MLVLSTSAVRLGPPRRAPAYWIEVKALLLLATTAAACLAGCGGADPAKPTVPLARTPYMGVSCDGRSNWIGCDRVGLYVWLRRHVPDLKASIAGRRVPMRRARSGPDSRNNWEGFLRPAGLIDGPLKVTPDRGRLYWFGRTPVSGRVRITVLDRNGRAATRTLRLRLAAGYG
jgi:hypothetical protein